MAAALIWSSQALDDIDVIAEFIARDSLNHAHRVVEGLFALGDQALEHPLAGRMVPELGDPQVRERFLYSYRLIYQIRGDRIEVLAVLHGRRLLESVGDRFE